MKIAVLAHLKYPIAQPFAGGLEMHTHLLVDALGRRGHDVTLFASEGSDPALHVETVCPPTGEPHGDSTRAATIDRLEHAAYRAMMERVATGGFDIVHNNSLHPLPLHVAGELGMPMITALHTPPFDPLTEAVRASCHCVVFVGVSRTLIRQWDDVTPDAPVIANGIDLRTFRARRRRKGGRHAFWSGRIVPEKGLHLAIDAARIAGWPLAFAGPRFDTGYWSREIAPRLGADVTDLGHLDHKQLASHLAAADVAVVSPRWDEPFGLVVAEALASGTPVAAFSRGAIPDLVDRRCAALAAPDDVADLACAITRAATLDRRVCRAWAERRFDRETMVDDYERLYARMIGATVNLGEAMHTFGGSTKELDVAGL